MRHGFRVINAVSCGLREGVVGLQCNTIADDVLIGVVHHSSPTPLVSIGTAAIYQLLL
jgi:hypothetical protein